MQAAGYNSNLIVLSPMDAISLRLYTLTGATYVFAQSLPPIVTSPALDDGQGFVCDTSAIGTLFISPLQFATFEENDGASNTSSVRCECHAVFVVQRPDAAAWIDATS